MRDLVRELIASIDPQSLLQRIVEQVCARIPNASGASVALRTAGGFLEVLATHGDTGAIRGRVVPVADTFQVYPLESGKSEIIGDTATDPRLTPQVRAISERLGVRSCLSIPLMNAGAAIGTLSVVAPTPYAFDPANVEPILSITEFLGVLINSNAQLATLLNNLLHSTAAPSHNRAAADFLASVVLPELSERDELERVIDEVLRHGRIDPVFQPIVELATGQVVAFEGLSRFASEPVRTPDVWMMMAHKVNRGVDMELTALRGLLDAALAIPDRYSVTVNLSPLALADAEVQQVLLAYPQKLVVELTEHEPAPELLSVSLEPVRRHGIKLAIDDAGSGFAGLTTILRLRPDIIKLDRELTIGIEDDPARRALATALSHFAGDIDAATVAEGIESDVQMQLLRDIGIRYGQGYHLARPQSVAALRDSVLSRP
ncbi:EAL domain-containing protein [Mycolicibacterium parafortuitum]|uniref:EAL domain-containing protein n=1 Tax=Mycolicibacterium parafortuitum TaxID=39692 RepID=UPI0009F57312|nr:EAL domain-containing protein [Mycolicibacterium parafortuitum]ORB30517.1 diguanylate phosphodiesterase [Mycolicibacterium parafortuitum]